MNAALKSVGERALIRLGVERLARRARRGSTVILAYHNIIPGGERASGDLSLHLPQEKFASQLDVLRHTHDVVPLHALFDSTEGSSNRTRAIITFDDAYVGAITAGVDELVMRGLPATIFVAPGLFGTTVWWDRLASTSGGVVPTAIRQHALDALAGKTRLILNWAHAESEQPSSDALLPRIGVEAQVIAAAARPGITLGSHSWSHPNLAALALQELESELSRPLQWLASHGHSPPWLAYPYGLYSETVASAAMQAGYIGALRIEGGLVSQASRSVRTALPRVNIPAGISVEGFRLRVVGL